MKTAPWLFDCPFPRPKKKTTLDFSSRPESRDVARAQTGY
jgi:hypothetical protein